MSDKIDHPSSHATPQPTTTRNMKAQKVTLKIKLEALSIDTVQGMLMQLAEHIGDEAESGRLEMPDGDSIKWKTTRKPVEF